MPSTVLAQCDAGIGVKNGVNAFGQKNFLGTFAPPYAVVNDANLLRTLSDRDWRSGVAEAIKVALIRDAAFFARLEVLADSLVRRGQEAMEEAIYRCAQLHLNHIATSGDPFELGSARPLDFGHWSAHRLEKLSRYRLRHGEAVAIGIAVDSVYSHLQGWLDGRDLDRILALIEGLGFELAVPELGDRSLFKGLDEFQEHLGGQLTVTLLRAIGVGVEVHRIDRACYREAIALLQARSMQHLRSLAS